PVSASISARPQNGSVAIVSVMKNEGPFVLDWIAHNRAIGVDRFLIYTNDCADGTDHLLDLLENEGVVRRDNPFRSTEQTPQYAAFSAAEREDVVTSADWLLTLDVDEYINIHAGEGRLSDLFDAVPEAHVISMPWRLFGNSDKHVFQDVPVTEQFTKTAPEFMPRPYQAWAFKSLYRNAGLFKRLGVHRPKGVQGRMQDSISWVTGSGKVFPPEVWRSAWRVGTANWGYDLVTLNHYAVRSADSFMIKRDRGRVNHVHELQDEAYWFRMNHNFEEDTSILRLAPLVAEQKARLRALPGVAKAHASAVDWHERRVAELKALPEMRAFYENITSPRMEKLSRLGPHFGMTVFMEGPHVVPDKVIDRVPGSKFHFTLNRPKPTK
ncbi:MAG: glycosyltransferase family 2 protein, partial [Paracoccaceae bacterium]